MKRLAFLAPLLALAACDMRPEHAEWQDRCASSHSELIPMSQYVPNGNGGGSIVITYIPNEVCDRYEPVCVAGKDGSTGCPATY